MPWRGGGDAVRISSYGVSDCYSRTFDEADVPKQTTELPPHLLHHHQRLSRQEVIADVLALRPACRRTTAGERGKQLHEPHPIKIKAGELKPQRHRKAKREQRQQTTNTTAAQSIRPKRSSAIVFPRTNNPGKTKKFTPIFFCHLEPQPLASLHPSYALSKVRWSERASAKFLRASSATSRLL